MKGHLSEMGEGHMILGPAAVPEGTLSGGVLHRILSRTEALRELHIHVEPGLEERHSPAGLMHILVV